MIKSPLDASQFFDGDPHKIFGSEIEGNWRPSWGHVDYWDEIGGRIGVSDQPGAVLGFPEFEEEARAYAQYTGRLFIRVKSWEAAFVELAEPSSDYSVLCCGASEINYRALNALILEAKISSHFGVITGASRASFCLEPFLSQRDYSPAVSLIAISP